jgi:hypothetical protein
MPRSTKEPFGWRTFVGHVCTFCVVTLCVGVLLGTLLGTSALERRAARTMGEGAPVIRIAWPPLAGATAAPGDTVPTWLPKADQEALLQLASDAVGPAPDLFSPSPLESISRALGASGWFEGLPPARRGPGHALIVQGRWRIPAAVVRYDGKDYLISWDAMPMPPAYEPGTARLPVILGSPAGPPRDAAGTRDMSTPWAGEGIGAALELLQVVAAQPWRGQVKGIDVAPFADSGLLTLVTHADTRVVWGGRPSRPRLGEVTTAQKLVHIAQVQHDYRRIDAGHPLIYVNTQRVQFDTSASAAYVPPTP